jgi:hypothetical protein
MLNITISEQEARVINAALCELPYRVAAPVISALLNQTQDQLHKTESEKHAEWVKNVASSAKP